MKQKQQQKKPIVSQRLFGGKEKKQVTVTLPKKNIVNMDEETKIQAVSVKESEKSKDLVPIRPPTEEELAFLEDAKPNKTVSVLCRIRMMNSSERLHWLHRVRGYKLPRHNIIAIGAGKK